MLLPPIDARVRFVSRLLGPAFRVHTTVLWQVGAGCTLDPYVIRALALEAQLSAERPMGILRVAV